MAENDAESVDLAEGLGIDSGISTQCFTVCRRSKSFCTAWDGKRTKARLPLSLMVASIASDISIKSDDRHGYQAFDRPNIRNNPRHQQDPSPH